MLLQSAVMGEPAREGEAARAADFAALPWKQILERAAQLSAACRHEGKVADYIPALACVAPDQFGMAVATIDGGVHCVGDGETRFSIQSISKVFLLTMAYGSYGEDLWKRVGQHPSTNPFNSLIELELERGVPRNPFLNPGALAVADALLSRHTHLESAMVSLMRELSGSADLNYDSEVFNSELRSSSRHHAAAYLMQSHGNFSNEVGEVVRAYCASCAIEASCVELARAGLFLANGGRDIASGRQLLSAREAQRVCALMLTTGTYEYSGMTAFAIGLPTKSGVGGGVLAVIPGRGCICAWSPRLDPRGNSVRAMKALELVSNTAGLSVFA
nr:glutaminase [Herbaspirillum seropedicae]